MAVSAAVALELAGCGSSDAPAPLQRPPRACSLARPRRRVRPEDRDLLVATHDGLLVVDHSGATERRVPVIDLTGSVVDGPERLLASGRPGPGVDLPQPVGLIESTDGGRTWDPVPCKGESDSPASPSVTQAFPATTDSCAAVLTVRAGRCCRARLRRPPWWRPRPVARSSPRPCRGSCPRPAAAPPGRRWTAPAAAGDRLGGRRSDAPADGAALGGRPALGGDRLGAPGRRVRPVARLRPACSAWVRLRGAGAATRAGRP